MISKFLRPACQLPMGVLIKRKVKAPLLMQSKSNPFFGLIPPSQYDIPLSKRFHLMYVLSVYWETIPLFITTIVAISVCLSSIAWACNNKVDVVYTTHSRQNISRTMDLRHPTVHKILIINQRYEPWPEMQDALDKMAAAEKKALTRLGSCSQA